jgi:hypothetical protein
MAFAAGTLLRSAADGVAVILEGGLGDAADHLHQLPRPRRVLRLGRLEGGFLADGVGCLEVHS